MHIIAFDERVIGAKQAAAVQTRFPTKNVMQRPAKKARRLLAGSASPQLMAPHALHVIVGARRSLLHKPPSICCEINVAVGKRRRDKISAVAATSKGEKLCSSIVIRSIFDPDQLVTAAAMIFVQSAPASCAKLAKAMQESQ